MALLAPAWEDGTLSVIHNIKEVDGKAVGIYGTKLSASLREINLLDMTTPLKTNDKNYIPNLSDFETTITLDAPAGPIELIAYDEGGCGDEPDCPPVIRTVVPLTVAG